MAGQSRPTSTAALLRVAYYELSRGIGGAVVAAGFSDLRPAHGNVLEQLGHSDGLRISQLAERTSMTAQSMGELVDDLESMGYVARRMDPADRRSKPVYLTDRGTASVAASMVAVLRQEAEIEERLGAAAYRALQSHLQVLGDFGIDPTLWRESPARDRD